MCIYILSIFCPLGVSVDIEVHIKHDENGTLKEMILANEGRSSGISMDDEFEKFMETIVGKGIMKSFAKVNMKDSLPLIKIFDAKKSESRSIVRIFVPETLDALINKKFRGGIPEALQRTIYRNSVSFKYHKLCISNSVFNTFFENDEVKNFTMNYEVLFIAYLSLPRKKK